MCYAIYIIIYFPSLCILHFGRGAKAKSLKSKEEEILKQLLAHHMNNEELPMRTICMSETREHGGIQKGPW